LDILDSLEVRWFLAEDHPTAVAARDWFASIASEGRRVDHYLLTERDDLGFKARVVENQPAKVETKYLLGSLGGVHLARGVVGDLERWRKLSLALEDAGLQRHGSWLAIEKDRRLRKFAFDNGSVSEVPVSSRPDAGCGIELTQLRFRPGDGAAAAVACTLGLEAFGPEATLLDGLQATCRIVFGAGSKLVLDGECSMSYPQWLRTRSKKMR